MFAGMDKKLNDKGEEKQNYSSYVEFNYPFSLKSVDLNVTCGIVPYKAARQYNCNGFAVTNVALKGTTAIRLRINSHYLFLRRPSGIPAWRMPIWYLG